MPHVSQESKRVAEAAKLRPTDVVVITFPKSGTTLLQQACEQLRTGGDMDFSEITERQPWLDFAWDCGQDLGADQIAIPRLFKSHQLLSAINPGAKYLSVLRDPQAVLMSWFAFQKGKGRPIFKDCADVNEYAATGHFEGNNIFGTNIWDFYAELWEARREPCLLVVCYEAVVKDKMAHLASIAGFLGVPRDAGRLEKAAEMTAKSFMLEHAGKFDDSFILQRGKALGRAAAIMEPFPKVTEGHDARVSPETVAWLQRQWAEKVLPRTGLGSYEALVESVCSCSAGCR